MQFLETNMRILFGVLALAVFASEAAAAGLIATEDNPKYLGKAGGTSFRLDHCITYGRNCGQDAADKYCQIYGYQRASKFSTMQASPTQTFVGQVCRGTHCIAFKSVTCVTSKNQRDRQLGWPVILDDSH
jgi:hypothetical protein